MNKRLNVILLSVLICFLVGCASTRPTPIETQTLISYEAMGEVLNAAKPILITLCKSGELGRGECMDAMFAYNEAVDLYKFLGNLASDVIDTGEGSNYRVMANQLMGLLVVINKYTGGN